MHNTLHPSIRKMDICTVLGVLGHAYSVESVASENAIEHHTIQ
jgi:hypothetical protein